MSIRDIIKDARSDWVLDGMTPMGAMFLDHEADQRFIATFDPEHVALMEAVVEAAHRLLHEDGYESELDEHLTTLTAYRKEHL